MYSPAARSASRLVARIRTRGQPANSACAMVTTSRNDVFAVVENQQQYFVLQIRNKSLEQWPIGHLLEAQS